jgi:hypothetical protein
MIPVPGLRPPNWNWGFTRDAPGQHALCRVCNCSIPKGQDSILLTTQYADRQCRIFFHPACFPEKSSIV